MSKTSLVLQRNASNEARHKQYLANDTKMLLLITGLAKAIQNQQLAINQLKQEIEELKGNYK